MSLRSVVDAIGSSQLTTELDDLEAYRQAAFDLAPFNVGDRVCLSDSFRIADGSAWLHFNEALRPGALGTVQSVRYWGARPGLFKAHWSYGVTFDVMWSTHRSTHRSATGAHRYEKRGGVFLLRANELRKACAHDVAFELPEDARVTS